MPDNRARVATTKAINLEQLDAELGGHGLCGPTPGEVVAAEGSPVTQQQLEDAVAAAAEYVPPDPQAEFDAALAAAAAKGTVEEKLDALLAALQGTGLPSKAAARGKA